MTRVFLSCLTLALGLALAAAQQPKERPRLTDAKVLTADHVYKKTAEGELVLFAPADPEASTGGGVGHSPPVPRSPRLRDPLRDSPRAAVQRPAWNQGDRARLGRRKRARSRGANGVGHRDRRGDLRRLLCGAAAVRPAGDFVADRDGSVGLGRVDGKQQPRGALRAVGVVESPAEIGTPGLLEEDHPVRPDGARAVAHLRDESREVQSPQDPSPVVHEELGLMAALKDLARGTENIFRIPCEFQCSEPVSLQDHTAATHLYRIAQEALSNAVYSFDVEIQSNSLDSHVSRLRKKLADLNAGVAIHTIRGVGYLLKAAE